MTDKVIVRNLVLFGHHGVYAEEHALGQRFHLDIAVETDLSAVGQSDEPRSIINYVRVIEEARVVFASRRFNLIEAIAEQIAAHLLAMFDAATAIDAQFDSVEVAIRRTRS